MKGTAKSKEGDVEFMYTAFPSLKCRHHESNLMDQHHVSQFVCLFSTGSMNICSCCYIWLFVPLVMYVSKTMHAGYQITADALKDTNITSAEYLCPYLVLFPERPKFNLCIYAPAHLQATITLFLSCCISLAATLYCNFVHTFGPSDWHRR